MSTTIIVPANQTSSPPTLNVCMMCVNNPTNFTPHENPHITVQTDFADVKSLASRLIAAIHADEIEKKLLRLDYLFFNLNYNFDILLVGKKVVHKYLIIFVYILKYVIY